MSEKIAPIRRSTRTWSLLGDVKKRPSPYEVVTSNFHYHFRRDPVPFELSPEAPLNRWYLKYREGSALQMADWEGFRDPQRLTYRSYVALQHNREVIMDSIIDRFEQEESTDRLSQEWLGVMRDIYAPARFPIHVLQMTALYLGQMAPSAFITNVAHFQGGDELRRVQWIAYRCKSLALSYGEELASSEVARHAWEDAPTWQPMRKVFEELLLAYDWGECFVAMNLVVKPLFDAVFNEGIGRAALLHGDSLTSAMQVELAHDSARAREWTSALVHYACDNNAENREVIRSWVEKWQDRSRDAFTGLAASLENAIVPDLDAAQQGFLSSLGL